MNIYLLTFYLFDVFENNIGIAHGNYSATSKAILTKCSFNLNGYIFYLRFALGIIHGDRCDRKTQKKCFIQVKPLFWSLKLVTLLLFEEILVLTSY